MPWEVLLNLWQSCLTRRSPIKCGPQAVQEAYRYSTELLRTVPGLAAETNELHHS